MLERAADWLLALPAWLVLLVTFLLPALEASTFLGLVVPGETAVFVAGVAASDGIVPLWAVVAVATAGAIVGDAAGYAVGNRWGERALGRIPTRLVSAAQIERAESLLRRRGTVTVILGRQVGTVRSLVPGLAGASGVSPRRFLTANAVGALLFALTAGCVGFLAGRSYRAVEHRIGWVSDVVAAVVVVGLVALWVRARRRDRARPPDPPDD
ncbi:DedA family protein [Rhodococcus sp. D2-41]|uniref:DedA family protein n=1 Tax=Speluncibacter jeojiensis TaxID=2710754 RepID=UPI0024109BA9|nr:DedA family protein [Rhodococcus sp. D2-41]MDG3012693.1 DedA family protein [Rhodococcus sp. D2-41]